MAARRYFLNLFSPRTWGVFQGLAAPVSAHKARHRRIGAGIRPGDVFIC